MIKRLFTDHPEDTDNPQTYWEHAFFAFWNSLILVVAGLAGMIHAIFPFIFPFFTSTIIIQSFKKLVDSQRHKAELKKWLPDGYINAGFIKSTKAMDVKNNIFVDSCVWILLFACGFTWCVYSSMYGGWIWFPFFLMIFSIFGLQLLKKQM